MFCPNCGKEIQDGSVFCPECGTRIDGATEKIAGASTAGAAQLRSGHGIPAAVVALVAVVAIVAVAVGAGVIPNLARSSDGPAVQQDAEALGELSVQVTGSDVSSCPSIVVTISVVDGAGDPATGLAASDFSISEKGGDGSSAAATVRDLVSNGGGVYQLVFQSGIPAGSTAPRSVTISPVGADHTWDAVGFTYNPPAQKDDSAQPSDAAQTTVVVVQPVVEHLDVADYILPNSDKVYYSRSDFAGLSDWELYVARNEIYARHGRGFKDSTLQSYFDSKPWYTREYSPEEFDSMADPLNSTERANADAIKAVERDMGSSHL